MEEQSVQEFQSDPNVPNVQNVKLVIDMEITGGEVRLDYEDYNLVKDYRWFINKCGYVAAWDKKEKRQKHMHRIIMEYWHGNPGKGFHVDHINGIKNDNCKSNLRFCTPSQNLMNRGPQKNNTSGFKGVYFYKPRNKWHAQIQVNGIKKHIGYFTNLEDAVKARRNAEIEYFGQYAHLD